MLGSGANADADDPNPGNEAVAPPYRDLERVGPALSFFSEGCGTNEGVRLNGSELVDACVDDNVQAGWVGGIGPKLNGAGDGFSVGVCAGAGVTTCAEARGAEVAESSGAGASVSDLVNAAGSFTA